jgi:hypothetical protein
MYLAAEGLLLFVDPVEWGRPRGLAGTGRHQRLVRGQRRATPIVLVGVVRVVLVCAGRPPDEACL